MKKLFSFILLLIAIQSFGQITPPTGYTAINQKYNWLEGKVKDLFGNAVRDTTFTPPYIGAQVYRQADSSIYIAVSITTQPYWQKIGGSTYTSGFAIDITSNVVKLDTTASNINTTPYLDTRYLRNIPTLQQVTDVFNSTNKRIYAKSISDSANFYAKLDSLGVYAQSSAGALNATLNSSGLLGNFTTTGVSYTAGFQWLSHTNSNGTTRLAGNEIHIVNSATSGFTTTLRTRATNTHAFYLPNTGNAADTIATLHDLRNNDATGKLNISDTAAMLDPYLRKSDFADSADSRGFEVDSLTILAEAGSPDKIKVDTLFIATRAYVDANAGGGGGSGTVNSGTQYRIAYYAGTGAAVSEAAAITASRVLVSDANGVPTNSSVTTTTLGYVDFTSSGQTQINSKEASFTETTQEFTGSTSMSITLSNTPKSGKAEIYYLNGIVIRSSNISRTGTGVTLSGFTRDADDVITAKYSY